VRIYLALLFVCILIGVGCEMAGDNSAIIKAQADTKPGMTIWEAIDRAERIQPADIDLRVWGKDCTHAGFEAGRHNGPRYLRIIRNDANKGDLMMSRPYTEHDLQRARNLSRHSARMVNCSATARQLCFSS
jgi:hypothetical protein